MRTYVRVYNISRNAPTKINMETALSLKNEGNKLFKEGKYEEALNKYTEALKYDSVNSVIYSNRSGTYTKLEKYDCALSDALECIKLNPQWAKGFFRKTMALKGLRRHDEAMQSACEGFRLSGEGHVKRELVSVWLSANQKLNSLPEGSIDLPRGICILSQDYLQVLACLMRSLSGECPLSLALTEQCLYNCAEQMEKLLLDFGEPVSPIIKEWNNHLPHEVYPYSVNPMAKAELEQQMNERSKSFTHYLDKEVDPALYLLLRPLLGLVILVVLNRTNILTECNTGHHSAELMNRALLPLFEVSILATDEYYSMYVGRLCAVLDSYIGRGYRLNAEEIATVRHYCAQLEKAVQRYPKSLPEYQKDKQLAERALSNVQNNILLPATPYPPMVPLCSEMSIELAEQLVKDKPREVEVYIKKRLQDLDSVKFLTMGEVEELLTMSGELHFFQFMIVHFTFIRFVCLFYTYTSRKFLCRIFTIPFKSLSKPLSC